MRALFLVLMLGVVGKSVATTTIDPTTGTTIATTDVTTIASTMVTDIVTVMGTTLITETGEITETVETTAVTGITETEALTTGNTAGALTTGNPTILPTTLPAPTEAPGSHTWSVKDKQGAVCMKMKFGARLSITFKNTSNQFDTAIIDAPSTATPRSACKKDGPREFILHFFNNGTTDYFFLNLTFSKTDSKFSLTDANAFITIDTKHFKNPKNQQTVSLNSSQNNFLNISVPLGKSFHCSHPISITALNLTLTDVRLQPFAEEAQGGFGDSEECKNKSTSSNKSAIIGGIIASILLVCVAAFIAVTIVKKRRNSKAEDMERLTE